MAQVYPSRWQSGAPSCVITPFLCPFICWWTCRQPPNVDSISCATVNMGVHAPLTHDVPTSGSRMCRREIAVPNGIPSFPPLKEATLTFLVAVLVCLPPAVQEEEAQMRAPFSWQPPLCALIISFTSNSHSFWRKMGDPALNIYRF